MLLQQINSIPDCQFISIANKLGAMKKARKELEEWQKQDAARLRAAYDNYARRTGKSQLEIAQELDWSTQGAVNQYINGVIPLNWKALVKFCNLIGVGTADISPTLHKDNIAFSPPSVGHQLQQPSAHSAIITAPDGKTMVIPFDLVGTVEDLLKAWATSTVTRRQLHAYRQMFRADAQLPQLPQLKEPKSPGIKKSAASTLQQRLDDDKTNH